MFLTYLLYGFGRQWQSFGIRERVLVGGVAAGLALAVLRMPASGAAIAAVCYLLVVLSRTGMLATRYQKELRTALKPLQRAQTNRRSQHKNFSLLLERLEKTRPPDELSHGHDQLIAAVRDVVGDGAIHGKRRDVKRHVNRQVDAMREIAGWRSRVAQCESPKDSYAEKMEEVVSKFFAEEESRRSERRDEFRAMSHDLRRLTPPARHSALNREVVDSITRMSELSEYQQRSIREGNESEALAATEQLMNTQQMVARAFRRIMGTV